jgi:UDP-N-acetylglucosamine 2-epimerase (non-hydrolysing)
LTDPQGYLEFLQLMQNASLIITDSGGIQEETTYLKVPCLTFRDTTERPVTVEIGTNQLLADLNPITVHEKFVEILEGKNQARSHSSALGRSYVRKNCGYFSRKTW